MNTVISAHVAARNIITWLRTVHDDPHLVRIDLDEVRQMLPGTPLCDDVREITPPVPLQAEGFEGALMRNRDDHAMWGIMYNEGARPERQRFTIAHELGHLILHRHRQNQFHCSTEDVHLGLDAAKIMEREADEFAANLLMPGDQVRVILDRPDINFHHLSEAASEFGVSLEAMCLRFVKYTSRRVILIHWDNGFLNYHWRSDLAVRTRTHLGSQGGSVDQTTFPGTLAANDDIEHDWWGQTFAANLWCPAEPPQITVRECKHSSPFHERVLTLLFFEDAEPCRWKTGWETEETMDSFDHFSHIG